MIELQVPNIIIDLLNKQKTQTSLRRHVAIQKTLYNSSVKYPVSFLYCYGYRDEKLVETVMDLMDSNHCSIESIQNDPMYTLLTEQ